MTTRDWRDRPELAATINEAPDLLTGRRILHETL